jgi:hypothetical protein
MPAFEPSLKSFSSPACLNDLITPLLYRSSIQRSTDKVVEIIHRHTVSDKYKDEEVVSNRVVSGRLQGAAD